MALPSARKMREHVRDLAAEMGVTVVHVGDQGQPSKAWGQAIEHPFFLDRKTRMILLSHKPVTPLTYMVAMHELGHCVAGDGWSAKQTLEREAAANEWAIENAILPLSLAAHHLRTSMGYYRSDKAFARSARFERLYARVTRYSRPHRRRKR